MRGSSVGVAAAGTVPHATSPFAFDAFSNACPVVPPSGNDALKLSGANTYSGGTTVSAGLLWVDTSTVGTAGAITSSAVGRSQVTVASGAALAKLSQFVAVTNRLRPAPAAA